jgi:hypothetical protein
MAILSGGVARRRFSSVSVMITFADRHWVGVRGDTLAIGRNPECAIVLPNDDHLSRRAGALHVLDDCVLVRNESSRKPMMLRPPVGADRVIEPGGAITSLPDRRFEVLLVGSGGRLWSISVDASGLAPDVPDQVAPGGPATRTEPIALSGAQRKVLAALCAPLLTESGPKAVPATYAQIGQRLGLQPQYVRNVIKSLRETLAGYGVEGLIRDHSDAINDDFRWELARWAIRSRQIGLSDMDRSRVAG